MLVRLGAALVAVVLVVVAAGGYVWHERDRDARRAAVRSDLATLDGKTFAPQKVIYHFADDGGFFDRRHKARLENLARHVATVGQGRADIVVVLQGAGLSLLENAVHDEALGAKLTALREAGVRFEPCRNSMIDRGMGVADLLGVTRADVVPAALAEIARLEAEGYVYIRL